MSYSVGALLLLPADLPQNSQQVYANAFRATLNSIKRRYNGIF